MADLPRAERLAAAIERDGPDCVWCRRPFADRRSPVDWLADCEQRGWEPNRLAIVALLRELADAISARGGQRRARPYLEAQLRRI